MRIRPFDRNSAADIKLLEDICRKSGSESIKKHLPILRRAIFYSKDHPDNLWCEIIDDVAFYMCTRQKKWVRGVVTVVREDMHGKGYGKALHQRRLQRMYEEGIDTFRFRTNQSEPAIHFWEKQGAHIIDVNGGDYEMEQKIKVKQS